MELQEVIDHARNEQKSELAKQIAEKLVILGAESIKYVKDGKYSFNHGMNVGQSKELIWVLEQLKAQEVEKGATNAMMMIYVVSTPKVIVRLRKIVG